MFDLSSPRPTYYASHKKIEDIADLGIVKVLPKCIPQINVPFPIYIIVKYTHLIIQPTVIIDGVPIGTHIQSGIHFFN